MSYLNLWSEVDKKRRASLKASDWTQVTDSPLSDEKKAEWAVYRKALRDMPSKWSEMVDKAAINPYSTPDLFPTKPSKS